MAALFHDIGKPRVRAMDPEGRPTFYEHERVSAAMAEQILLRLKLPHAVVKDVSHLIAHHMFNYQEEWSDAAVRRLIARVGDEKIKDIIALRRADQVGMCRENARTFPEGLANFAARVSAVLEAGRAFTVRQMAADGDDIMSRLGLPPGPRVGIILEELLQAVLDDPSLNEKEKLLQIAERFYNQRLKD